MPSPWSPGRPSWVDLRSLLLAGREVLQLAGAAVPEGRDSGVRGAEDKAVDFLVQRASSRRKRRRSGSRSRRRKCRSGSTSSAAVLQGDKTKYQAELKKEGITEADIKADLEANILAQKISDRVAKAKPVTDQQAQAYYDAHKTQYSQPESRQVAHILVKSKALADKLYQELQGGADFGTLAAKYSTDTASAKDGGKLVDTKGSFVPEFEQVAFALKTGEIGKPVKSQYGWHVIKALGDTQEASTKPFSEVKSQIVDTLQTDQRNKAMQAWVAGVRAKYAAQVGLATGFHPVAGSTGSAGAAGTTGP